MKTNPMDYRTIVVAVITHKGKYLICKKPSHLGVFAGQWGLPGGGIEPNEKMLEALEREVGEEVGLKIIHAQPLYFRDDIQTKLMSDGTKRQIYMIYLIFTCESLSDTPHFNDNEFKDYAWVSLRELHQYDLNPATILTFEKIKSL